MQKDKFDKISIITPTYNQGHFIEQTICSVLDQGYPNLEYIIMDGGSTDNTVEVIKKYEKHISYWVSEKDNGQSDAINKGLKIATGEIINWLNSDDYYNDGALLKVGEAFIDNTVNVYTGRSRVFGNGKEYLSSGTDIYKGNLEKTIGWARIDQPETFFRKSVWDNLGGIDSRLHYIMDREFWIRYLLSYGLNGILCSREVLVNFRLHEHSKTVIQQNGFIAEGYNLFYSMALDHGLSTEARFLQEKFNASYMKLDHQLKHGDMKNILHYFLYCLYVQAYATNDFKIMNLTKQVIDPNVLSITDRLSYNGLLLRSRIIPVRLKKWWNRQ